MNPETQPRPRRRKPKTSTLPIVLFFLAVMALMLVLSIIVRGLIQPPPPKPEVPAVTEAAQPEQEESIWQKLFPYKQSN